jgi:hypothetical protein
MALPPEDIDDLIEASTSIVVAEVQEVLTLGADPADPPGADQHLSGLDYRSATQDLKLKRLRVLFGQDLPEVFTVHKPDFNYILEVGEEGVFFLRDKLILGRYGSTFHTEADTLEALAKQKSQADIES